MKEIALPFSYYYGDQQIGSVTLMPDISATAEVIINEMLSEEPLTWLANILACTIKQIGDSSIAPEVQAEYIKKRMVTIPKAIEDLPYAHLNTLILEVHRNLWASELKQQANICQICSKQFKADIDLSYIKLSEEDTIVSEGLGAVRYLNVPFTPFTFVSPVDAKDKKPLYPAYDGVIVESGVFRIPLVRDAIRHQVFVEDKIAFWRNVGFDCLVELKTESGESIPASVIHACGKDYLYNNLLSRINRSAVMKTLRDDLPALGFTYEHKCPCPKQKTIPYATSAGSFFGD
jgi:hypothetical protein